MKNFKRILLIIFWLPKQIGLLIWFVLGGMMSILTSAELYYLKSMMNAEINKGLKQAEKLKKEIECPK
jgi:hypothetical protein